MTNWWTGLKAFLQFRKLELMLGLVDEATQIAAPASRRPRATHRPLPFLTRLRLRSRRAVTVGTTRTREPLASAQSAYLTRSSNSRRRKYEVTAFLSISAVAPSSRLQGQASSCAPPKIGSVGSKRRSSASRTALSAPSRGSSRLKKRSRRSSSSRRQPPVRSSMI